MKEHGRNSPRGDDHVPYLDCIRVNNLVPIRNTVSQGMTAGGSCYLGSLCITSIHRISIYDYLKIKKKKKVMAKKSLSTSKLACHPPAASAHRQLLANHIIFRRGPSRCTTYSSRGLSLHQEVTAPKRVTFKSLFGNLIFIAFVAKGLFRL